MLKAKSLKITSALSMGPVHGGTQDKIAQVVADIADMENYIVELFIRTLEGTMHVPVGSYVIQGVRGEIYCCKEDIFLETYEPVLESD